MNSKRILFGALAGGIAWTIWSMIINMGILGSTYMAEGSAGHILAHARYGTMTFMVTWIVTLFILSGIAAFLYAAVRTSWGPGPKTALKLGVILGFTAGFPINLSITSWIPLVRTVPLWWMLDLWVGAIIATVVAGFIYKEN